MGIGIKTWFNHVVAGMPGVQSAAKRFKTDRDRFQQIYESGAWDSPESGSGKGSEIAATVNVRQYLPSLFARLDVRSMLDAPCGDWNWMKLVDLSGVSYTGGDIVPSVIETNRATYAREGVRFIRADLKSDVLPKVDLILCRDCLIHLSFEDARRILENFRSSGATWLLTSTTQHVTTNANKITGQGWRHINLCKAPFGFPEPKEIIDDHVEAVPQLGLWRIDQLPALS